MFLACSTLIYLYSEYQSINLPVLVLTEQVKNAERVQVESIPLPDMMPDGAPMPGGPGKRE